MGVTGGAWHAPPPPHISFGYAGGLSPDNITEQVRLGVGVGTRVGLARVGVVRARVALLTTHYSPLTTQLARIAEAAPGRELWVDMETGVRPSLPDGSELALTLTLTLTLP